MMTQVSLVTVSAALLLAACGGDDGGPGPPDGGERVADETAAVAPAETDLRTLVMSVPAMSCALCVRSIRVRLEEAGLTDIDIDLATKRVQARFDPDRTTASDVEALVEGQGFPVRDSWILTDPTDGASP